MASHVPRGWGTRGEGEDRLYILQDALSAGMAFEWRAGARRFMRIRTRVSDNGANASVYLYTSSFPFQSLLRQTLFVSGLYRPLFPERRQRQIHYHLPPVNTFGYFEITARHSVVWATDRKSRGTFEQGTVSNANRTTFSKNVPVNKRSCEEKFQTEQSL